MGLVFGKISWSFTNINPFSAEPFLLNMSFCKERSRKLKGFICQFPRTMLEVHGLIHQATLNRARIPCETKTLAYIKKGRTPIKVLPAHNAYTTFEQTAMDFCFLPPLPQFCQWPSQMWCSHYGQEVPKQVDAPFWCKPVKRIWETYNYAI